MNIINNRYSNMCIIVLLALYAHYSQTNYHPIRMCCVFQAMYSSVIPGELMRGSFPQMVTFPAWLGQNSSRNKSERILQETRTHMRLQWVT